MGSARILIGRSIHSDQTLKLCNMIIRLIMLSHLDTFMSFLKRYHINITTPIALRDVYRFTAFQELIQSYNEMRE